MTSYVFPKKGVQYITYISLEATAGGSLVATPTLAAGDFKVSIDGGALADLATLPTNTPAGSGMVKITLSTSEMNGDNITVKCVDAAGAEWLPVTINIQTSARQIDDLAYPTTSGRSIDVSAGGEVGIDWANIGSPTTVVGLSGTTVKTATDVETDTQDIQARLPAALTAGGNIKADALAFSGDTVAADNAEAFFDGTGYAGTNNVIPLVTTVTNLTNAPTAGDLTATMKTSVTTACTASTPTAAAVTGNVGGNVVGSVASVTAGVTLAASAVTAIWDKLTSALTTVGSIGKLLVDNVDAAISSRASATNLATVAGYLDTEIADIKAKTDLIPASPAAVGSAMTLTAAYDAAKTAATQASVDTVDTVVDAVKAKTDSLTFTVAGQVDANIQSVNDVTVTGTGAAGDEWGP